MKTSKKKNRKKRRIRWTFERVSIIVFVVSLAFYFVTKVCVSAYNITLSNTEQQIAAENIAKQNEVEELQATVRTMQDKKQMLGMLENQVQDNQNNIYIIGDNE
ncbi:hypothetical protein [Dubosiella muris]|uniref:Uncharacterized protein n=1 Tax=Dubosiella muris TaxID=3038133 RepID=A0AC61R9W8_9FIRM|nr:hypothetical protein [Dubosiella muris]TGY66892.1 hypothetical protein E5336_02050 [Dubosiella muris]